ncbi:surfeit locus protein 6 homolog [Drosophila bipectinata]|uniref:surfeit locus protein 6 homolog n=1 Tax=Drosophila bipectinata TaxID=42026 RepID=UPI001C88ED3E|nr:surfeit locus protein 6 homolog [Drosophila bipectinata]
MTRQAEIVKRLREEYEALHGVKKKPKPKAKQDLLKVAKNFQQRVLHLLTKHKVPYTKKEDEETYEDYLLPDKKGGTKKKNKKLKLPSKKTANSDDGDVNERIASIKNKLRQKKKPTTEKQQKRREAKKLKRSKGVQKLLLSSAKNLKNENVKQQKLKKGVIKSEQDADQEDSKGQIKSVKVQPVYNQEAKIVYSKVDFAANPGGKTKKSHKNPKEILKKLRDTKKQLTELREQGDTEKAAEMQNDIAWRKAFDKVEGKKVKDDTKLLQKAIKKKTKEKKKAKNKWTERKQKVEHDIAKRQKKRQENLDKRSKDKKKKKLKTAAKKGRIIPGY